MSTSELVFLCWRKHGKKTRAETADQRHRDVKVGNMRAELSDLCVTGEMEKWSLSGKMDWGQPWRAG